MRTNLLSNSMLFFCLLAFVVTQNAQVITQTFVYSGSIQQFTVPTICPNTITIQAKGAQGGFHATSSVPSGLGADIKGVFAVSPGQVLNILVGQQPSILTPGNGGGGGSFVTDISNNPLVVAGGGGGSSGGADSPSKHGQVGTSGGLGAGGGGLGGTNGAGGLIGATFAAGAGGGLLTNGQTGWAANTGGIAFVNGGLATTQAASGGFGGGGSGSLYVVGGGGGGYSGGGAGSNSSGSGVGGGGGSFNGGSNQVNTGGVNSGHGVVYISYQVGSVVSHTVSPGPICVGSSATLSASGVNSYTWTHNNSNATSVSVNPASSTSYTVQGTDNLGCISQAVINVTVSGSLPVLTVTNSAASGSICMGSQATLTAGGALSYTWSPLVTNGVAFVPSSTTTYTVYGANGCGITTAITTITVSPLPVNAISSEYTVCALKTITLTSGGANTYTWSTNQQGVTAITAPTITTVYTVTGQIGACIGTGTVQVDVNPNPTITIAASGQSVCAGGTITLNVSGALTYTWTQSFLSGTNVTVSPVTTTVYAVSGTNQHTCTSTSSQLIIVAPLPVLNVSASRTLVCSGFPSTVTASGNSTSYSWQHGGTSASSTVNPVSTSIYTVTGTSSQCSNTKTVQVAVFSPTFVVTPDTAICEGGSVLLVASGASSYTWAGQTPGSSYFANPSASTTYSVYATVISANNYVSCEGMKTVLVDIYDKPVITATSARSQICRGEKVVLSSGGGQSYLWSNNESTSSITITPQNEVTHTVTGTDGFGCVNTATVKVRVSLCPGFAEHKSTVVQINVFPNPNAGNFIVTSEVDLQLLLINETGQVIRNLNVTANEPAYIKIEDLPAGLYLLSGQTESAIIREKIIVSK